MTACTTYSGILCEDLQGVGQGLALVWGRNAEGVETARSDWSRAAIGEQAESAGRSLAVKEGGRSDVFARDKCVEWAAADASRGLLNGSGCTCERE